jgi:hypothetical protein
MRRHLPSGFEEGVLYGMISWFIPAERHGHSYNGQPLMIAALASQKNHLALYLTGVYSDPPSSAGSPPPSLPPARSSTWASPASASAASTTCRSTSSARSRPASPSRITSPATSKCRPVASSG